MDAAATAAVRARLEDIDQLTGESYDLISESERRTNYINACRIARSMEAERNALARRVTWLEEGKQAALFVKQQRENTSAGSLSEIEAVTHLLDWLAREPKETT
ncbi:MAG: hypothetical protein Q7R68_11190 [Nitrospirales bacterium]|nr:hypothetical protein [Nitrospirales bacterium]